MHYIYRYLLVTFAFLIPFLTMSAKSRRAEVKLTTTEGIIVVELYNETPRHRDNFLHQVKVHTYDGVLFHRVIDGFMIQSGDPHSKNAKPGEHLGEGDELPSDWLEPEFRVPTIKHQPGALAAAREGDAVNPQKKSSSQQFYIVTGNRASHLDGAYTVFGAVKSGMDVACRIQTVKTNSEDRPIDDIRILKAKVIKKYKVKKSR